MLKSGSLCVHQAALRLGFQQQVLYIGRMPDSEKAAPVAKRPVVS